MFSFLDHRFARTLEPGGAFTMGMLIVASAQTHLS